MNEQVADAGGDQKSADQPRKESEGVLGMIFGVLVFFMVMGGGFAGIYWFVNDRYAAKSAAELSRFLPDTISDEIFASLPEHFTDRREFRADTKYLHSYRMIAGAPGKRSTEVYFCAISRKGETGVYKFRADNGRGPDEMFRLDDDLRQHEKGVKLLEACADLFKDTYIRGLKPRT